MQPRISVIIRDCQGAAEAEACLEAMLGQSEQSMELLCLEGTSDEEAVKAFQKYEKKDPRVHSIASLREATGTERNFLLAVQGKYVYFPEASYKIKTDFLERAVKALERDRADVALMGAGRKSFPPYTPFRHWQIAESVFRAVTPCLFQKVFSVDFLEGQGLLEQILDGKEGFWISYQAVLLAAGLTWVDGEAEGQQGALSFGNRFAGETEFVSQLFSLPVFLQQQGIYEEIERDFVNYAMEVCRQRLETLSGKDQREFYEYLKGEGFFRLGVLGREAEYFYEKETYCWLRQVQEYEFSEYQTKLSVVIPVHNAKKYVRQCLDSILKKQDIGLEVICVDDCSTDETPEILKEYENKYHNFKYLRNETNLFAGASRNRGLLEARGQYVHFLDADDYVIEGAYKKLYSIAAGYQLDWLKTTAEGFDDQTGEMVDNGLYALRGFNKFMDETLLDFHHFPRKFFDIAVVPWNGIYRRKFLLEENIRFNHLFCVNDRSFYMTICIKGRRMMVTREKIVRHRVNISDSLVGKRAKHFDCQFASYWIMNQICDENQVNDQVRFEILEHELYDLFSWYRKFLDQGQITPELEQEMRDFVRKLDIPYFERYGEKSRWLVNRELVQ